MINKLRFAICSGIYAVFYSFCLYKNLGGATFPFFVIGTLCYIMFCTKEFSLTWKKDTTFFMIMVTLIGLSHPLTDKMFIHVFNVFFSFIILIYIALHQFSYDANWSFFKTLLNLLSTMVGAFSKFFEPFKDLSNYNKIRRSSEMTPEQAAKRKKVNLVLLSVIFTLPLLVLVIALLSSADYVFNKMISNVIGIEMLKRLFTDPTWFKVLLLTLIVFLFVYGLFSYLSRFPFSSEGTKNPSYDATAAITAGILLDIVYLAFSLIQILYLFIKNLSLPIGITYAEYARKGFFQLLFVCALNLCLVLIGKNMFADSRLLKVILTVMCVCTYIMTASSTIRLIMYISYYYLSFARVLAFWALFVITVLLTGLLVHVWTGKVNLFKFSLRVILIAYTLLAFSHADYFITKFNLSNIDKNSSFFVSEGYNDYDYILYMTCLDAAPVIEEYNLAKKYRFYEQNSVDKKITVRNFNLSRYIAKQYKETNQ